MWTEKYLQNQKYYLNLSVNQKYLLYFYIYT